MGSKYIVIEGLEGAGKTTARDVVVDTLRQKSCAVWCWTFALSAMRRLQLRPKY